MRRGRASFPQPLLRGRRRVRPAGWLPAAGLLLLALGYLSWPYLTLWRLDRAIASDDRIALAHLVDLPAVRAGIARRLDKESGGGVDAPSDAFIAWLEQGLRKDGGSVLERRVTLEWVRESLLAAATPGGGLVPALRYAFFDGPLHFSARFGDDGSAPVRLRLTFDGLGWRVTTVYY